MSKQDKEDVILTTDVPQEGLSLLEGRSFQVHVLPDQRLRLVPIRVCITSLVFLPPQCPVELKGEQCGKKWGHEGKHVWANGD